MDPNDFNSDYLNWFLENIYKQQKYIFLRGDFIVDILNYNEHNPISLFLHSLMSNLFIPLIWALNRIASYSYTLTDKKFWNIIDPNITSANLVSAILDYLPQFAIISNMFGNTARNKSNIYERDWIKFDLQFFIIDYFFFGQGRFVENCW